jgi:hypothetical protein
VGSADALGGHRILLNADNPFAPVSHWAFAVRARIRRVQQTREPLICCHEMRVSIDYSGGAAMSAMEPGLNTVDFLAAGAIILVVVAVVYLAGHIINL